MRLDEVMTEVAQVMQEITGLRVFDYPPGDLRPPAGVVSYPESIDFDQTYGRGQDQITGLPILLLVGKATERSARDTVAAWASGDGVRSLKRAIEAHAWTSCDDVNLRTCRFDVVSFAEVDYLAAMFEADVVGAGTD